MAQPVSFLMKYRPQLRQLGILAGVSMALALLLVVYTFGVQNHFFGRLFTAFFVFFWLLAVMFLGIVPFVTWAARSWFGKEWKEATSSRPAPRRAKASTSGPSARTPTRTASRSGQ